MKNLNFDKEITALSCHRSVQRFHFRGGSRSCQIARKILCQTIRKVTFGLVTLQITLRDWGELKKRNFMHAKR